LAPRMISTNDLTAFDLYLLLLRKYDGNPNGQVDVDYPELIKIFGLDKRLSYENACDQLAKALLRLERNYKLIRRALRWQKGPSCYLLDYAAKGCYQPPEENYCALPDEYWQYGYNHYCPDITKTASIGYDYRPFAQCNRYPKVLIKSVFSRIW